MEYFEVPQPDGNGLCSDNECPCADTIIPRGKGYLCISPDAVYFRRDALSVKEMHRKVENIESKTNSSAIIDPEVSGAILTCEKCARQRNLDLKIAAADAAYWWEKGLAPLRATPSNKTGVSASSQNFAANKKWWEFWK